MPEFGREVDIRLNVNFFEGGSLAVLLYLGCRRELKYVQNRINNFKLFP